MIRNRLARLALAASAILAGVFASSAMAQPAQWNYSAPNNVSTAVYPGNVVIGGTLTPSGGTLPVGCGTLTSAAQICLSVAGTWNNAAANFTSVQVNMTDTASGAGTLLMDLQRSGVSQFNVSKGGAVTAVGSGVFPGGLFMNPGSNLSFGNNDVLLTRESAGVLAMRNGANPQAVTIYNTFTSASVFERIAIAFSGNIAVIRTQNAGAGLPRDLYIGTEGAANLSFQTANTKRWNINSAGHFIAELDNTYDVGTSSGTRPRNVYVATNVVAQGEIQGSAFVNSSAQGRMTFPSDGVVKFSNNALTDFGRLQLGGTTTSFPSLKRNGSNIDVRVADDSAYAGVYARIFWTQPVAVASLGTCSAGEEGGRRSVTDANATTFWSIVAAGGANHVPVYCDGTNWRIG